MQYGLIITAGDPATVADLAAEAEAAGWDGVFYFDAIAIGSMELYDPWVVLAAIAQRTSRVRIGAIVTPPARRRPWKLAREAMTLDRLSGGRLVLPVGLGVLDDAGFGPVGEPTDIRVRAELLDEALEIITGLWSGQPFAFAGPHYSFPEMTFLPTPIQRPRVPIWVVGVWPRERSMRRAIRWDGIVPQAHDEQGGQLELSPEHVRAIAEYVASNRPRDAADQPFEIIAQGVSSAADPEAARATVRPWVDAGATWWIEADWQDATVDSIRARISAGPPAVA
jgi:alkanesulfonate monooxygenase SsuD/methylene tetrahydromethanopterin reductase-like flavin-dependent oxidoreductase (luciferase family)